MGSRAHPLWVQQVCALNIRGRQGRLFHTQHPACPQDMCRFPSAMHKQRSGATACGVQAPLKVLALACSRHR